MRKLVIAVVLVLGGLAMGGCGAPNAHDQYLKRQSSLAARVDKRTIAYDFHNAILMDTRPTHLGYFIDE